MRTLKILVTVILCLFFSMQTHAQVLSKNVTLNYSNQTIEYILKDIAKKYKVNFSYSSSIVPVKKKISLSVKDKSLKHVLDEIFRDAEIAFEEVGSQVVLKKGPKRVSSPTGGINEKKNTSDNVRNTSPDTLNLSASAADSIEEVQREITMSEEPLVFFEEPSIEEKITEDTIDRQTLRKQYVQEKRKLRKQYYSKLDSMEKSGQQTSSERLKSDFNRAMFKLHEEVNSIADSIEQFNERRKQKSLENDTLIIKETTPKERSQSEEKGYKYSPAQVTVIPPLGTNGHDAPKTVNSFSFNLFAGVSAGLEGVEIGSLVNVEKDYVRGAQIAGLGNVVGHDMTGGQIGGLFNIVNDYVEGAQIAGLINMAGDSIFGFQWAGFMNMSGADCKGGQVGGFLNMVNGQTDGPQIAGFMNLTRREIDGVQVAGFLNAAGDNIDGSQIAGFMNVAPDTIKGVQVAGFLNYGRKVKGSQIGFINIADSITGIQVGFLSIGGYRRFEIFGGETIHGGVAFKTGSRQFYNIFTAGGRLEGSDFTWAGGYGLGGEIKISNRFICNIDLISWYVKEEQAQWEELSLLNQLRPTFGVVLSKNTSLFAGPVLNVSVSDHYNSETNSYGSLLTPSSTIYNETHGKINVAAWIGFNAGIRF